MHEPELHWDLAVWVQSSFKLHSTHPEVGEHFGVSSKRVQSI